MFVINVITCDCLLYLLPILLALISFLLISCFVEMENTNCSMLLSLKVKKPNATKLSDKHNKIFWFLGKKLNSFSEVNVKRVRCQVQIYSNYLTALYTTCMIKSAVGMKQPETEIIIISDKCSPFRLTFQDVNNMMLLMMFWFWLSLPGGQPRLHSSKCEKTLSCGRLLRGLHHYC